MKGYCLFIKGVYYHQNIIDIPNICYILMVKHSNHRYSYSLFFYSKRFISVRDFIRSKKELYDVVQDLCDMYLNDVVQ